MRSAVYGAATSAERRAVHWALAAALEGDDEQADRRAWHLAASTLEPDEGVVHALDEAAERAVERGGHAAAAKALERAASLTCRPRGARAPARAGGIAVDPDGSRRRGDGARGAGRALTDDPVLRAECAFVLGAGTLRRGRPADAIPPLVAAASAVAPHDAGRAAELLMQATSAAWQSADASAVLEIARIAKAVVPPDGDATALFFRRVILGFAAMMNSDHAEAARCLEPAIAHGALTDQTRQAFLANLAAIWLGDDEAAGALAGRAIRLARASGEVGELVIALGGRSAQLIIAQRHDEAEVAVHEAAALARELSAENILLLLHAVLAILAATQGRSEESHRLGEEVVAVALAKGLPNRVSLATYALAVDDINRARWAEALERFDTMAEQGTGDADPVMAALMLPDKVEAAVRAGRPEVAREALRAVRGMGDPLGCALPRRRGWPAAGRCSPRAKRRPRTSRRCWRSRTTRARSTSRACACSTASTCGASAAEPTRGRSSAPRSPPSRPTVGAARRARAGGAARNRRDGAQARPEHDRPAHPAGAADRALRGRAGCRTRRSRRSCSCRRGPSTRTCARSSRSSASRRARSLRGSRSASPRRSASRRSPRRN